MTESLVLTKLCLILFLDEGNRLALPFIERRIRLVLINEKPEAHCHA